MFLFLQKELRKPERPVKSCVMHLDNLSREEVPELNTPTAIPLVYEFNGPGKPISHTYM